MDDIPEALRETSEPKPQPRVSRVGLTIGLAAIALGAGGWFAYSVRQASSVIPAASPPAPSGSIVASPSASPAPNTLLGHFAYAEAPQAELQAISGDGGIKLRKSAAEAFRQMSSAAQAEGVILAPLSAFRSLSDQQHVFF